jgi:hypothetical protein
MIRSMFLWLISVATAVMLLVISVKRLMGKNEANENVKAKTTAVAVCGKI